MTGGNPAKHFGAQMRRERLAKGWSLDRFAAETGVDPATASLIERGHRGPNLRVAQACDKAFPNRDGYFVSYFNDMQSWDDVPAAFKSWSDREADTRELRDWWPSVISGLLQTSGYASAHLWTYPGATEEQVSARLMARMGRQERLFARPVRAWFIVDVYALDRLVGSPDIMAGQMRKLLEVAAMPDITVQVLPGVGCPGIGSGLISGAVVETWRKSTYSDANGGACVEVAGHAGNVVIVRDTTDRDGRTLAFGAAAWSAFLGHLK